MGGAGARRWRAALARLLGAIVLACAAGLAVGRSAATPRKESSQRDARLDAKPLKGFGPKKVDAFAAERHRLEVQAYAYYCRWVVELQRQHPDVDLPPYRSPYAAPGALHAGTTAAPMVAADGAALP